MQSASASHREAQSALLVMFTRIPSRTLPPPAFESLKPILVKRPSSGPSLLWPHSKMPSTQLRQPPKFSSKTVEAGSVSCDGGGGEGDGGGGKGEGGGGEGEGGGNGESASPGDGDIGCSEHIHTRRCWQSSGLASQVAGSDPNTQDEEVLCTYGAPQSAQYERWVLSHPVLVLPQANPAPANAASTRSAVVRVACRPA